MNNAWPPTRDDIELGDPIRVERKPPKTMSKRGLKVLRDLGAATVAGQPGVAIPKDDIETAVREATDVLDRSNE